MKLHLPYSFFALFFLTVQLTAQPSFHYLEKLTVENGLSSNAVSDIVQDGDGYLWIGTSYGLDRYDGTEVNKFYAGNNGHSLPNNKINDLELLDSFHIAVATNFGLSIFDTRNKIFRNIFFKSDSAFQSYDNHILSLTKDKQGNLWVTSLTSLYRFDSLLHLQKTFHSKYTASDLEKVRIGYLEKITLLKSGDLLLWSNSRCWKWNHKIDKIEEIDFSPLSKWYFLKNVLFSECFKIYGHYLITIHQGHLSVYDEASGQIVSVKFSYKPLQPVEWKQTASSLQNGYVAFSLENKGFIMIRINNTENSLSVSYDSTIYFKDHTFRKWGKDNEGNWWVTTVADGLIKFSSRKQLFKEKVIINLSTGKPSNYEITGFYSPSQRFFIATYGDGIYELDSSSGKLVNHKARLGKQFQNIIWNIHGYKKDTLWVGTGAGLFSFNLKKNKFSLLKIPHPGVLDSFAITTDFTDSKGLQWMGVGRGNGVCVYNSATDKFILYPNKKGAYPFRYPLSIAEDSSSNLWFLSDNTHDLVKWNRSTKQFTTVPVFLENGKRNFPTGKFYLDKKGIIWYGLETFGLLGYNTHTGKFETYGLDKGLNTDVINSITEDKLHQLWLATNQGLSVFNPVTKQFVNFTAADGLPEGNYTSRFYYDSSSQSIYTGVPGKVISFSPEDFVNRSLPMKVVITGIVINNNPTELPGNKVLKLSYNQNDITIYFTGINLSNGAQNNYAYKLGGKEAKWVNIGGQRQISFASLKPGTYDFAIRAARKDGTLSPLTDHFSFIIKPAFTSTAWFYLILLAIISGGIYTWYRYRLQEVRKLEKIRAGISHDLHDEIGSRLTNISMMSLVAKQHEPENSTTGEWLDRIKEESQAVSQSMREIVWNINPDNDLLEEAFPRMLRYTTEMLEAKGIEVKASITNLQSIKMDMEKRRDLFLIFKETIQNVLKHSNARSIAINLDLKDGYLFLNIRDDGKGFDPATLPFLNGLEYMKQRALQHHWNFEINSNEKSGTEIRVKIKT